MNIVTTKKKNLKFPEAAGQQTPNHHRHYTDCYDRANGRVVNLVAVEPANAARVACVGVSGRRAGVKNCLTNMMMALAMLPGVSLALFGRLVISGYRGRLEDSSNNKRLMETRESKSGTPNTSLSGSN